ncbi:HAMP domain-containing protein [Duganella sp. BJB488]|uniref:methyl-accepting chemotaxis protein n=1 Tax=unclassified Duganella TaxID=2636909 RepID=UPI000E3539CE|nr:MULTISPECIES: methyl-accepting chemotaxis protein [unclassified Duganella]RFP21579.1 HAMP domain-containing protein [Duganella sp. BJB489]RFP23372.1 HAMP domain-containing protein [Duganella sp. BJB488]RFP38538.1 HAMP domain-containing protein [Duganella sp. BJB480]
MGMLANISIGKRLALGFSIILAFAMLITGISVWRLQGVATATSDMMQVPLAKERMISDWSSKIDSAIRRTTAIARSSDPSLAAFFADEAKASSAISAEYQKKVEALIVDADEMELFKRIGEQRKIYLSSRDQVTKLKSAGDPEAADKVFTTVFVPGSTSYLALMQELLKMQRAKIDASAVHIDEVAASSRNLLYVLALLVLAFGAVSSWLLTTGITGPLRQAVTAARRVAGGDLTGHIDDSARDETGQLLTALKEMNASLLGIVTEVRNGTDHITTSSSEIAAGNQDLSRRTEQQAGALEETASSMEELTSTVKHNADNARQANQLAASAAQVAVKGGQVVSQVVDTMDSINQSSRKIVDIIAVIDGIAFQTNILALNAAVEAARAGEQGRGFAVVATEVRNLAQRSASAAKEIKELIGDSVEKVNQGSKLVADAGSTMDEIVTSVHRVSDIITEITAASNEQSAGINEVYQAIGAMDGVTQQNAALVEQAAAAAESMQQQAAALAQAVSVFKVEGSASRSRATPARATAGRSALRLTSTA